MNTIEIRNKIIEAINKPICDENELDEAFLERRIDEVLSEMISEKEPKYKSKIPVYEQGNWYAIETTTGAISGCWTYRHLCEDSVIALKKKYKKSHWNIVENYPVNPQDKIFVTDSEMIIKLESLNKKTNQKETGRFCSIESNTGAINGFYTNYEDCVDATNFLKEKYVGSNWIFSTDTPFENPILANDRFHQDESMTELLISYFGEFES